MFCLCIRHDVVNKKDGSGSYDISQIVYKGRFKFQLHDVFLKLEPETIYDINFTPEGRVENFEEIQKVDCGGFFTDDSK